MSIVQLTRVWNPEATTVGNVTQVQYTMTLVSGNFATLQNFTDTSIGTWATNFVSMVVTDTSTGAALVNFGSPVNSSTPTSLSIDFPGPNFCTFEADGGVAQLTITMSFTATTVGEFGQPFGTPDDYEGIWGDESSFGGESGSDSLIIEAAVCVAEGTLVNLFVGEPVPIQKLHAGDLLIGEKGEALPLKGVIKLHSQAMRFRAIEANQFGPAEPTEQLLVCEGHPIKIGKRVALPEQVGREVFLPEGRSIYTLITPGRGFVRMQGLLVATWSEEAWSNFVTNDPRAANLSWSMLE